MGILIAAQDAPCRWDSPVGCLGRPKPPQVGLAAVPIRRRLLHPAQAFGLPTG